MNLKEKTNNKINKFDMVQYLEKMRKTDVKSVDESLVKEINEVSIDTSLPVTERITSFVKQVGNPYCFKSHGVIVKLSFSGTERLEDCLSYCISLE